MELERCQGAGRSPPRLSTAEVGNVPQARLRRGRAQVRASPGAGAPRRGRA
ncbi:hypothetical protein KSP39_PZI020375 [Platanthera zijinensis]|uniref:Uncharacterized protein n=1 Tax=Platanthera zijinensis TaxID=2320716 RepID=A0AAP0FXU6_9ASPA